KYDSTHALLGERLDGSGDREIGLSRSRRPDPDDDVVFLDLPEILGLTRGLCFDDFSDPGQSDAWSAERARWARSVVGVLEIVRRVAEPKHVVRGQIAALAREIDHPLADCLGALD